MQNSFQHIYKQIDTQKSILYIWFEAMHTRIDLILCNLPEERALTLAKLIYDEVKYLEKLGNRFNPESEISKVNDNAAKAPIKVSDDLYKILNTCLEYYEITSGAFDITIQSLNNCRINISDIILDSQHRTVFFKNENIKLDLCGCIKGYALDKAKELIHDNNCTDALINMGNSSVLGIGNHPYGLGWKVSTNFPSSSNLTNYETVLYDECLSVSGNLTEERMHIINPITKEYIRGVTSIMVITSSGFVGDILSTALIAFGKNDSD